jgi:hypothetical protein
VRQGNGVRPSAFSHRVRDRRAMSLLHRNRADGAVFATRYSSREIML